MKYMISEIKETSFPDYWAIYVSKDGKLEQLEEPTTLNSTIMTQITLHFKRCDFYDLIGEIFDIEIDSDDAIEIIDAFINERI